MQLTLAESRRLTREPMFLVGTVGFPVLLWAFFVPSGGSIPAEAVQAALAGFAAFPLVSLTLFSFGANVSSERKDGWLRLLRASPMPLGLYLCAKVLAAWVYGAVSVALLLVVAGVLSGAWLGWSDSLLLMLKLLLGASPLVALGLAIGFAVRPAGATVAANIVNLVLVFGSGLAMPLALLPDFAQKLAPLLPTYYLGAVARSVLVPIAGEAGHWLALAAFTLVFAACAVWAMSRDEFRG